MRERDMHVDLITVNKANSISKQRPSCVNNLALASLTEERFQLIQLCWEICILKDFTSKQFVMEILGLDLTFRIITSLFRKLDLKLVTIFEGFNETKHDWIN